MDGKEAIINKIISDAQSKADSILSDATKKSCSLIGNAEDWAKKYRETQEKILEQDKKDVLSRRLTVAELDVKKLTLKYKQDVIEKVLQKAYENLCNLKKAEYLEFVEKLIEENAEENDKILLSKDNVLSEGDVKSLKVYTDKNLTVCKERGDFIGGAMLIGSVADKDLTFKAVIDSRKDILVKKIANELFGK